MTSMSDTAPDHHVRTASSEHANMFDALRKRTNRHEQQRERRIDSLVQQQREQQLRVFRRTGR